MKSPKPVLNHTFNTNRPVVKDIKRDQEWSFSFKYYKQIKLFGLDSIDAKWFVSLIEKLSDFSKIDRESFFKDHKSKQDNRYHKINWNATNIPIKKRDLSWIDTTILENEEEFPFLQFQISKALGRVVGFWNSNIFHIVLLDPKHNIQPAGGKYNYRVDESNTTTCKYTYLINKIDEIKGSSCFHPECSLQRELHLLQEGFHSSNFVYFQLEDDYYKEFRSRTEKTSVREIIELGLASLD